MTFCFWIMGYRRLRPMYCLVIAWTFWTMKTMILGRLDMSGSDYSVTQRRMLEQNPQLSTMQLAHFCRCVAVNFLRSGYWCMVTGTHVEWPALAYSGKDCHALCLRLRLLWLDKPNLTSSKQPEGCFVFPKYKGDNPHWQKVCQTRYQSKKTWLILCHVPCFVGFVSDSLSVQVSVVSES
jgi:hypothetical protein